MVVGLSGVALVLAAKIVEVALIPEPDCAITLYLLMACNV